MMKRIVTFILLTIMSLTIFAQKELTINPTPADALVCIMQNGKELNCVKGAVKKELEKNTPYSFRVRKEGYLSVDTTYFRKKDADPMLNITLTTRIVKVSVSPLDAHIYVDQIDKGSNPQDIIIPKGKSVLVEVKKPGFGVKSVTYYNIEGKPEPEASHLFKMDERIVYLKTQPADADIFIDGHKQKEQGSAEVSIPNNECVKVKVIKPGFATEEVSYCNKDNEATPPTNDVIKLKDRLAEVSVDIDDAAIIVDGKEVGKKTAKVKIMENKCAAVVIKKGGYVTQKYEWCNKSEGALPDAKYTITMDKDQAYDESEQSDQANKAFTIQINGDAKLDWQTLVSIISSKFDEIQTIDATTNYLRTAWVGEVFNKNTPFPSMVRTRVVVTNGGFNPLKFNVKVQSEMSKVSDDFSKNNCVSPTANQDECFEPWNRVLRKYSEMYGEILDRIK
jgi:hypothetical protein